VGGLDALVAVGRGEQLHVHPPRRLRDGLPGLHQDGVVQAVFDLVDENNAVPRIGDGQYDGE